MRCCGASLLLAAAVGCEGAEAPGGGGAQPAATSTGVTASTSASTGAGGTTSSSTAASGGSGGGGGQGGFYDCPLGLGEPERVVQLAGGYHHTLALTSRGRVYCWGADDYAGCMHVTGYYHIPVPTLLPALGCIESVTSEGFGHPNALTLDGRFLAWGGEQGEGFGDGPGESSPSWEPTQVLLPGPASETALSVYGGFAELDDGSKWSWGEHWPDFFSDVPVPHVGPSAVVRADLVCDIDADGLASCMGENVNGTVGDGTVEPRYELVPILTEERFTSLTGAYNEMFGITVNGEVVSWGESWGQLGNGVEAWQELVPPTKMPGLSNIVEVEHRGGSAGCALDAAGLVSCWGAIKVDARDPDEAIPLWSPVPFPDLGPAIDIAKGGPPLCSLKTDHTVWCRGNPPYRGNEEEIPPDGSATRVVFPFEEAP